MKIKVLNDTTYEGVVVKETDTTLKLRISKNECILLHKKDFVVIP